MVHTQDQIEGWGVLTVANPEFSGVEIYKHLKSIGVKSMDFLYPDYHYDNIPNWKPGSIARYYIEIFDQWYQDADESFTIRWFNSVLTSLLIGGTKMASIGLEPLTDVIIETDGSLEPYDALRTITNGITRVGLNIMEHSIEDLYETELFQMCLHHKTLLAEKCKSCPIVSICGGGSIVNRWSKENGFNNPSVYCDELMEVIMHIRNKVINELDNHSIKYEFASS